MRKDNKGESKWSIKLVTITWAIIIISLTYLVTSVRIQNGMGMERNLQQQITITIIATYTCRSQRFV